MATLPPGYTHNRRSCLTVTDPDIQLAKKYHHNLPLTLLPDYSLVSGSLALSTQEADPNSEVGTGLVIATHT